MSYYDVDAILTESQKLPCTFQLDVPGLGYLDGSPGETVGTVHKCPGEKLMLEIDYGRNQDRAPVMAGNDVGRGEQQQSVAVSPGDAGLPGTIADPGD